MVRIESAISNRHIKIRSPVEEHQAKKRRAGTQAPARRWIPQ
jgi:hypothetical protein